MEIAPDARQFLDQQRVRLAGAELPSSIDERTRTALQQAINESFVFGFRVVMLTAAGLALVSAVVAFIVIENKLLKKGQPNSDYA
jgi:hypothetical protein